MFVFSLHYDGALKQDRIVHIEKISGTEVKTHVGFRLQERNAKLCVSAHLSEAEWAELEKAARQRDEELFGENKLANAAKTTRVEASTLEDLPEKE